MSRFPLKNLVLHFCPANAFFDLISSRLKGSGQYSQLLNPLSSVFVVVFLIAPLEDRRRFMLRAHELGMTSGDYVFYTIDMLPDEDNLNPAAVWKGNDGRDSEAREAFKSVFHVSAAYTSALQPVGNLTNVMVLISFFFHSKLFQSSFYTENVLIRKCFQKNTQKNWLQIQKLSPMNGRGILSTMQIFRCSVCSCFGMQIILNWFGGGGCIVLFKGLSIQVIPFYISLMNWNLCSRVFNSFSSICSMFISQARGRSTCTSHVCSCCLQAQHYGPVRCDVLQYDALSSDAVH